MDLDHQMKMNHLALLFLFVFGFTLNSFADGINAQTLNPSVSDHYVLTEDGYNTPWPANSRFYIGANYNYVSDPLVAISQAANVRSYTIINSIQTFDLMAGFKVNSALGLFVGLPIHQIDFQNNPGTAYPSGSFTKTGDLKLMAKIRISPDESPTAIALIPELHIGTGNDGYFVSDTSSYWALRLAIEQTVSKHFQLAGNIGYAYSPNATYSDPTTLTFIDNRNRIPISIGSFYKFNETWGANLEYSNTLSLPVDQQQNPNDLYLGARCAAAENLILSFGGAIGKVIGPSGQNYRIIAGIRFAPFDQKPTPTPTPTPVPVLMATPTPVPTPIPAPPLVQEKLVITLDVSSVPFAFDTARLPKYYSDRIREIGRFLGTHKNMWRLMTVQGNTDERGSNQYNDRLSKERAFAVRQLLLEGGTPVGKLKSIGYGKRRPLDRHHNERAWATNRRVDLEFRGVKDVVLIREGVMRQTR